MRVRDQMTRKVLTLRETDDIGLAVQMMAWAGVSHLPVVRDAEVIGVVTERDVLGHVGAIRGRDAMLDRASEVMSHPAQTAHPDDDLAVVAARLATERIGCLPVIEKGKLVGIITATDVLSGRVDAATGRRTSPREPVSVVMSRNPPTAAPDDLLLEAIARMSRYRVRHLPVVDGEGHVVGILADRDVRTAIGDPRRTLEEQEANTRVQLMRVGDVMTRKVEVLHEHEPLSRAVDLFLERGYGAFPVVGARDKLVGMVSYLDVLKDLAQRTR